MKNKYRIYVALVPSIINGTIEEVHLVHVKIEGSTLGTAPVPMIIIIKYKIRPCHKNCVNGRDYLKPGTRPSNNIAN